MTTHASKACCETPPTAHATGYTAKGTYSKHADLDCYITGPRDAKKAIFFIYDVFGFQEPTLQGADILASGGYLVVMPDFWEGKPLLKEWFADRERYKVEVEKFMARIQVPKPHIAKLDAVLASLKDSFPSIEKWGTIGYCWGGKIVALTSGEGTAWSAAVSTSPARVDAEDAKHIVIPMAMLASKDEPADAVEAFGKALTTPKHVETFSTQIHGWMSARAELSDPEVKKEYERGYQVAVNWFGEHL